MSRRKKFYRGPKITVLGSGHGEENSALHYGVEWGGKTFDMFLDFAVNLKYSEYIPQKVPFYVVISHLHPDHINWGNLFQSVVGVNSYHPVLIAPEGTHEYFEHALSAYRYTGKYRTTFEVWEISSPLDPVDYKQNRSNEQGKIVKYFYEQSGNFNFEVSGKEESPLEQITEGTFSSLRSFFQNRLNGVELQQTFGDHSLPVLESAVVNVSVNPAGLNDYLKSKKEKNGKLLFDYVKNTFNTNFPHSREEASTLEEKINKHLENELMLKWNDKGGRAKGRKKKLVRVYFNKVSYLTDTVINASLSSRFGSLIKDSRIIFAGANKLFPDVQVSAKHFSLDDLASLVTLSFAYNEWPIVVLMHSPQNLLGKKGALNLAMYALGPEYVKNNNLKRIDTYITSLRNIGHNLNIAFPGLQAKLPLDEDKQVIFVNKKGAMFELP